MLWKVENNASYAHVVREARGWRRENGNMYEREKMREILGRGVSWWEGNEMYKSTMKENMKEADTHSLSNISIFQ